MSKADPCSNHFNQGKLTVLPYEVSCVCHVFFPQNKLTEKQPSESNSFTHSTVQTQNDEQLRYTNYVSYH